MNVVNALSNESQTNPAMAKNASKDSKITTTEISRSKISKFIENKDNFPILFDNAANCIDRRRILG